MEITGFKLLNTLTVATASRIVVRLRETDNIGCRLIVKAPLEVYVDCWWTSSCGAGTTEIRSMTFEDLVDVRETYLKGLDLGPNSLREYIGPRGDA